MDYKIVYGESMATIEKSVKQHIAAGWIPQGGLAIQNGIMYQVIIKH